jgi:hypothetical protein
MKRKNDHIEDSWRGWGGGMYSIRYMGCTARGTLGTNFLVACAPQNRCPLLHSKAKRGFLQFKEPGPSKIDLKTSFLQHGLDCY